MKTFLQTLIAVLIALFIKDQVDIYLLESRGQVSFEKVQSYLLDFLHDGETPLAEESGDNRPGSHWQQPPASARIQPGTNKDQAWQEWYAAVAPEQCLKPVLNEDFVACTDVRIKARQAFETSWKSGN